MFRHEKSVQHLGVVRLQNIKGNLRIGKEVLHFHYRIHKRKTSGISPKHFDKGAHHAHPPLVVREKVCHPSDDALDGPGVLVSDTGKHNLPRILQIGDFTLHGLRQDLLHLVELTTGRGHAVESLLDHFKRHLAGRNAGKNLSDGNGVTLNLLELVGQFLQNRDTGLRKLTDFLTAQELSRANLAIGENDTAHINAKTRRHIREFLRGLIDLVHRHGERRQLLRISSQVLEGERRLDRQHLQLIEDIVCGGSVLQNSPQSSMLSLELASDADHVPHNGHGTENRHILRDIGAEPTEGSALQKKLLRGELCGIALRLLRSGLATGQPLLLLLNVKLLLFCGEHLVLLIKQLLVGGNKGLELLEFLVRDGPGGFLGLQLRTGQKHNLLLGLRLGLGVLGAFALRGLQKIGNGQRLADSLLKLFRKPLNALHFRLELLRVENDTEFQAVYVVTTGHRISFLVWSILIGITTEHLIHRVTLLLLASLPSCRRLLICKPLQFESLVVRVEGLVTNLLLVVVERVRQVALHNLLFCAGQYRV